MIEGISSYTLLGFLFECCHCYSLCYWLFIAPVPLISICLVIPSFVVSPSSGGGSGCCQDLLHKVPLPCYQNYLILEVLYVTIMFCVILISQENQFPLIGADQTFPGDSAPSYLLSSLVCVFVSHNIVIPESLPYSRKTFSFSAAVI